MKNKTLELYKYACEQVAKDFANKHFPKDPEFWFINDDPTGVVYINDHFYSISDMYEFLKYKYSSKKMFDYYYQSLEHYNKHDTKSGFPNIKNFRYFKK